MTLLIKNAHIVDGGGAEPFRGDILTDGDTISAVGSFPHKKTDEVIDCQGAYVTPGFIDAHSVTDHYGSLLKYPEQDHYSAQGITSAIGGYDGLSLAPFEKTSHRDFHDFHTGRGINADWHGFADFFKSFSRLKPNINFGSLVGYRSDSAVLERALGEGALGISFGANKSITKTAEKELDALLAKHPEAVLSLPFAEHSAAELKRFAKLTAQGTRIIFHNVMPYFAPEADHASIFKTFSEYAERGLSFAIPASQFVTTSIAAALPDWVYAEGRLTALEKLSDEWLRKKIMAAMPVINPGNLLIVHAPNHAPLVGLTLKEFMQDYSFRDAREALVKVMRITELRAAVRAAHFDETNLAQIFGLSNVLVGSFEPGAYRTDWHSFEVKGGFLDLVWAAEQKGAAAVAGLAEKIARKPAAFFGIADRGMIKEGWRADLVGFKNKSLKFSVVNGRLQHGGQPLRHQTPINAETKTLATAST